MKKFHVKHVSLPGTSKVNEDYILCHQLSENHIITILADGMGGLSFGAEAARIVSKSILTTILDKFQEHSPEELLRIAFYAADSAIHQRCMELKCKMGAAVTVTLLQNNSLYYAWQGNVRLYKVSTGEVPLLTTDHVINDTEGLLLTRCINGKGFREDIPIKQELIDEVDRI